MESNKTELCESASCFYRDRVTYDEKRVDQTMVTYDIVQNAGEKIGMSWSKSAWRRKPVHL